MRRSLGALVFVLLFTPWGCSSEPPPLIPGVNAPLPDPVPSDQHYLHRQLATLSAQFGAVRGNKPAEQQIHDSIRALGNRRVAAWAGVIKGIYTVNNNSEIQLQVAADVEGIKVTYRTYDSTGSNLKAGTQLFDVVKNLQVGRAVWFTGEVGTEKSVSDWGAASEPEYDFSFSSISLR